MDRPIWERLESEPQKAYAAFCAYRDLGYARSLLAAYRAVAGKNVDRPPGHIYEWSTTYAWVDRARAYDDDREATRRRDREHHQRELDHQRWEFERSHHSRLVDLVEHMTRTAKAAMDATIRACEPPPAPSDEVTLLEELRLDEEGNPLPPPDPPLPVRVNVSGLARLIQETRNTAREAACGLRPLAAPRPEEDSRSAGAVKPGAQVKWVPTSPPPTEK